MVFGSGEREMVFGSDAALWRSWVVVVGGVVVVVVIGGDCGGGGDGCMYLLN